MNYYELLKITPAASPDEIKQAFASAVQGFKKESELAELEVAFDTLIYPTTRSQYDLSLGLVRPGENAVWRKYYQTYSNEFIERDRSYKNEVMPLAPSNGKFGIFILVFLLVLVISAVGFLAYRVLSDPVAFKQIKAKYFENEKKEELKPLGPIVDYPDLAVIFPEQSEFISNKINSPCAVADADLLSQGSDFAVYWVARFNCERLAGIVLASGPVFNQISWKEQVFDPVSFAKLFGSRAVVSLYEKYSRGHLNDIRLSREISAEDQNAKEIELIKTRLSELEKSIHFYKAERACKNFSELAGTSAILLAYQKYYDCISQHIKSEQKYRDTAGHAQIPK